MAFNTGFGLGIGGIEITYEVIDDGDLTISLDYSALYDLGGSPSADALVSLTLSDSLSGELDAFDLLPGDPTVALGTLSIGFTASAGATGSVFLSASAAADTAISHVPVPGALLLTGAGCIGLLFVRTDPA